jgi:hypothetical protein
MTEGEVLEAPKKRKLNAIGRPKGAINKVKTLSGTVSNSSILDFTFSPFQTPSASDTPSAGVTPVNNTPAHDFT